MTTFDITDPRQVARAARDFVAASTAGNDDYYGDMNTGDWMEYPLPTDGAPRLLAWDQSTFERFIEVEIIPLELGPDLAGAECGTACCVAGFVKILAATDARAEPPTFSAWSTAQRYLDLTGEQAESLFEGDNDTETVLAMLDELIACPGDVRHILDLDAVKADVVRGAWEHPSRREVVVEPNPEFL